MLSYGEWVQYLKILYDNINGEINTIIPATMLALTEPSAMNVNSKGESVGTQCMMTVEIRLYNALKIFSNYRINDTQIRGCLLYILAHELSHCDQKIDRLRFMKKDEEKEYELYIEYTNNINTMEFILDNQQTLQNTIGPFEIPPVVYTAYTEQKKHFNNAYYVFPQISSIKERVLDDVSIIAGEDLYKTRYPFVNNINLDIYIQGRLSEKHKIIKNKNLICGKSNVNRLSQIISRGLFSYRSNVKVDGDTCKISLYMDNPPVQNVVIVG